MVEGLADVGAAFVADGKAAEAIKPGRVRSTIPGSVRCSKVFKVYDIFHLICTKLEHINILNNYCYLLNLKYI